MHKKSAERNKGRAERHAPHVQGSPRGGQLTCAKGRVPIGLSDAAKPWCTQRVHNPSGLAKVPRRGGTRMYHARQMCALYFGAARPFRPKARRVALLRSNALVSNASGLRKKTGARPVWVALLRLSRLGRRPRPRSHERRGIDASVSLVPTQRESRIGVVYIVRRRESPDDLVSLPYYGVLFIAVCGLRVQMSLDAQNIAPSG